ncbi:MAG: hypothetical protein AB2799_19205 [Candidatus Thiodiazotropha sp.]
MNRYEQAQRHKQTGNPELELERRFEENLIVAEYVINHHSEELSVVIANCYDSEGDDMRDLFNKAEKELENGKAA